MISADSAIIGYPRFEPDVVIKPHLLLSQTSVFDLDGVNSDLDICIEEYRLLKKLRNNRIIDSFVGFSCFSITPRPRTTISKDVRQIVDEVYFGKNRFGHLIAIPVIEISPNVLLQLSTALNLYEIYQSEFTNQICVPIIARFVEQNVFALWTFHRTENQFSIDTENHYRLVRPDELSDAELASYQAIQE